MRVEPPRSTSFGKYLQKSPKKDYHKNHQSLQPKENRGKKFGDFNDSLGESSDELAIIADPNIGHERRLLTESCIDSNLTETNRIKKGKI